MYWDLRFKPPPLVSGPSFREDFGPLEVESGRRGRSRPQG